MKCRSCGAEIAEKAIVCYRCGTSTADLSALPGQTAPRRTGLPWPGITLMVLVALAAVWLIPKTTPGSVERIAAWVATWLVVFAIVASFRRRARR